MTSADLAVCFDDDGAPRDVLGVLDLDTIAVHDDPDLLALIRPRADRIGLIGVSTRPLPASAEPLLSALTLTLVGPDHSPPPRLALLTITVPDPASAAAQLVDNAAAAPRAAFAAMGLLRLEASVADKVVIESFAYSMLLGGPEFAAWRSTRPVRTVPSVDDPVRLERGGDRLDIVLDHPARRNSFSRELRAALVEALALVELDPSIAEVRLSGAGPTFCSGGDLDEFGEAHDLAAAHPVRLDQSAGLAIHRVADRVTAALHGTCIGAGVEVPAFASRVLARPGTTFRLPELGMGLVPGAGGTASITHRIGPWRTAYLVLSGVELGFEDALDWGLIDGLA